MRMKEEKETPMSCITYEANIIRWFGLYPRQHQEAMTNRALFYAKCIFNFGVTLTFFASMWTNLVVHFDDKAQVIETLYFGLTETTFVSKLLNIHLRFHTYEKVERYLADPVFNKYTEEQHKFVRDGIRILRRFACFFRVCITLTILFFAVFPFLDDNASMLIVPGWFPPALTRYPIICYFYQLWAIIVNGYPHCSIDCITAGLIIMGSVQFKVLKDNLNNLRKNLPQPLDDVERLLQEEYVLSRLGVHVHHHVTIIQFAYDVENMVSFVQFNQFLSSSIIICVTGFQVIVTPFTDLKFITLILYFSCNLVQVLMCCWFGHDIMTKSEGVGEACYMSDWYNCGNRVGRTIFIIMERSKRPVVLTAGKFFDLTLQTLMQVLKTSYSYLALLRRMNEIDKL